MTPGEQSNHAITHLLDAVGSGEDRALEMLWEAVVEEVRVMASAACRRESRLITLQPTAVINEVFIRLHGNTTLSQSWQHRGHFFGSIARAMSQVLVDAARKRQSRNRTE
jgi:ribose 1,5-bisphosphokinase PhnN